jgi:hypothetical protein
MYSQRVFVVGYVLTKSHGELDMGQVIKLRTWFGGCHGLCRPFHRMKRTEQATAADRELLQVCIQFVVFLDSGLLKVALA